jgi:hypothetical protein
MTSSTPPRRLELRLERPRLGLLPKPTVVVGGRGQPAQWGVGTWAVDDGAVIGVFLFNRLWRFGAAEVTVGPGTGALIYRAPMFPFGRGRLRSA